MGNIREEMKKKAKTDKFERGAYEKKLLESLKKASNSNNANKYPRNGDRGGR